MNDKIILFGSGTIGGEALDFLGSENVECFCDNNINLVYTEKSDKNIISFEELKKKYKDRIIIISVNIKDAYAIARQCEENDVLDYLFYESLKKLFMNRDEMLDFLTDFINRERIRKEIYFTKVKELQTQVDYFKRNTDIRHMKPAEGKLRARQLELVKGAAEFLKRIDSLDIKPILYGGNLLGHVRHNGFIPWDDDIDFALIRKEYEKLKEYCRQHIYTIYEFFNKDLISEEKDVEDNMRNYYWRDGANFYTIYKPMSNGDRIRMDFFVLDYYADDYSVDELLEYTKEVNKKFMTYSSIEKKIECLEEVLRENRHNTVSDSNNIYFGIDNMEIKNRYHRGQWIPKEVVFPLKKVLFEGEYFWVPNNPEEFVKYEYEDIWGFPDDVGISIHMNLDYH